MKIKASKTLSVILVLSLLLFSSCGELSVKPEESQGGICLTFDDTYVNQWHEISPILIKNKIKATFFATMIHSLSKTELHKLQLLDSLGFEIGCHGYNHINAEEYLKTHTLQNYFDTEVFPALKKMNEINLYPTSYSYPYGRNNDSLDVFMLKHFKILRDITEEQRKPSKKATDHIDEIFKINEQKLRKAMKRAQERGEVLCFYAHCPVKENPYKYQITHNYIKNLIALIKEYKLKTYTISELAN